MKNEIKRLKVLELIDKNAHNCFIVFYFMSKLYLLIYLMRKQIFSKYFYILNLYNQNYYFHKIYTIMKENIYNITSVE